MNPNLISAQFERKYSRVFSLVEDARMRALANGESWPAWCYAPIAASQAVMQAAFGLSVPGVLATEAAKAAGLSSWRMGGKNVLVFDEDVLAELWSTPVTGDIPTATLLRLPFWCAYIPLPERATGIKSISGMFVHLEHDANTKKPELRFLVELAGGDLMMIPLNIDAQVSLPEAISRTFPFTAQDAPSEERAEVAAYLALVRRMTEPLVSLTLYLCADNAEIREPRTNASAAFDKQNPRRKMFAPPRAAEWNVAWRIGAALRRAGAAVGRAEKKAAGEGTKRPHMRKAHWHAFRTGSRADAATWKRVVHWLPPIPVNMPEDIDASEWADLMPTTERRVK